MFQKVSESVTAALDHNPNYPINWELTNALVKETVSKLLLEKTGRCPVIVPVALEV